jgi:hypothetical protein
MTGTNDDDDPRLNLKGVGDGGGEDVSVMVISNRTLASRSGSVATTVPYNEFAGPCTKSSIVGKSTTTFHPKYGCGETLVQNKYVNTGQWLNGFCRNYSGMFSQTELPGRLSIVNAPKLKMCERAFRNKFCP